MLPRNFPLWQRNWGHKERRTTTKLLEIRFPGGPTQQLKREERFNNGRGQSCGGYNYSPSTVFFSVLAYLQGGCLLSSVVYFHVFTPRQLLKNALSSQRASPKPNFTFWYISCNVDVFNRTRRRRVSASPIKWRTRILEWEKWDKGFTQKWMRQKGFCTWGFQIGPFAACWADFVSNFSHHPDLYTGGSHFLLPQREEGRKQQWLEMRKGDSLKSEWDTGVSVLGAFTLDHLLPVGLIVFQKISTSLTFIQGFPFLITPERVRKEAEWIGNEKKGFSQKWLRHRGFCTWGIQIGPFAACWADFVLKNFHLPDLCTGAPISYYPRESKEGSRMEWKWEKRIHPKVNESQGFLYLRHSNWTICCLLGWFCSKKFPPSWPLYWGSHFLLPQRE